MTSAAFRRLTSHALQVTRNPAADSLGRREARVVQSYTVSTTDFYPVDPEVRAVLGLGTAVEVLETFTDPDADIHEGDGLIMDGKEYVVRSCAEWGGCKHLILLEEKRG